MIYLSSACSSKKNIGEAVQELAELGFKNIELTGGTKYYDEYETDLLRLQDRYELNYLVHNYFPPPKESFVLNLASLNDDIFKRSLEHGKNAIALSKKLGAKQLGFHAGFLVDISVKEIGKKLSKDQLFDEEKAIQRFCEAFTSLQETAGDDLTLYVENNVFSTTNARTYQGQNPFMLTNYQSYLELKEVLDFNLLLDVAHLKVSVNSLGLDFTEEFSQLFPHAEYVHLSENDGLHDQNKGFTQESPTLQTVHQYDFSNKTVTLEIYRKVATIHQDYQVVREALGMEDKS